MKLFSFGNLKLPKTTAIFNMTPANFCPSDELGLCQLKNSGHCYAKKAERMYPNVLPYRIRQATFWDRCKPTEFVNLLMGEKITHLRFNESGDFRFQKDIKKAVIISDMLFKNNIVVHCYTARHDLNFQHRNNLIVNGAGFMIDNNFVVVESVDHKLPACCGDCRKCSLCMKSNHLTIQQLKH